MKKPRFDSVIFDMDGTLWDAVDTYRDIWNTAYRAMGVDASVTRRQLLECMGMTLDRIAAKLNPPGIDTQRFYDEIRKADDLLMPRQGGILYPGVKEMLPPLASQFRLFMVSNCGDKGLDYFLDFTGLRPYFTDIRSYGATLKLKDANIRDLCREYSLASPVYVGDTDGDCRSAHAAGVPMIHVTYGFGRCDDAEFQASSFAEVVNDLYVQS